MERARTLLISMGPLALLLALTVIGVCWALNPWFDFWRDAFSDFGVRRACCPWLYNYGLIAAGLLFLLYSAGVLLSAATKVESFASGLLFTASLFLTLIGLYPGGTRPHTFVSTWFFAQSFMGFGALGYGIYRRGDAVAALLTGIPSITAIPAGLAIDAVNGWPSAASAEAAGIAVIAVSLISSAAYYLRQASQA